MILIFLGVLLMCPLVKAADALKPLPLPKTLRIESAKPRGEVWKRLDEKQKKLAQHLFRAGIEGRTLLFAQSHRHSLALRDAFLDAFSEKNIATTKKRLGKKSFDELIIYAAKFLDQAGPYSSANRKYVLTQVTAEQLSAVMPNLPEDAVKLLLVPEFETRHFPESPEGEGLDTVGGNHYEKGITAAAAKAAKPELNCRVLKEGKCEKQTVALQGPVGEAVRKVVAELKLARPHALTEKQGEQIDAMIRYFEKGDVEDFRQANIAWVKDRAASVVDFMNGWVEVYEDWQARIGTWESYVQVIDPEVSRKAEALAKYAQYFEDAMPYGTFKKKFPADYSPPAIMVYYFQEIASYRSGGYNLPNFDDIRRDVGAKNVIRLPLPGEDKDAAFKAMYREMLEEYAPKARVADLEKRRQTQYQALVLMHEIIGHGSGTYDVAKYPNNEDPISGLGSLGSALEEQRADLTALVNMADPKLVEIGLYKNQKEAEAYRKAAYDYYLADFLRRLSGQRTMAEAHQRGHWLFVNLLLEKGAIEWVNRGGGKKHTPKNAVLAVKDYALYEKVARDLLQELQRIKAERDSAKLTSLFAEKAPLDAIGAPWAQAIIERGEKLKINAGYVEQPWLIDEKLQFQARGGTTLESLAPHWTAFYR